MREGHGGERERMKMRKKEGKGDIYKRARGKFQNFENFRPKIEKYNIIVKIFQFPRR